MWPIIPWLAFVAVLTAATSAIALRLEPMEEEDYRRARDIDRALVGDTAALKDEGELEVTLTADFTSEEDKDVTELTVEFEYGLTNWFEVGVTVPYRFVHPTVEDESRVDGLADVELSLAVAVIKDPILLTFSLTTSFPSGDQNRDDNLGEGVPVWEPAVNADIPLGDFELVLSAGWELKQHDDAVKLDTTLAYEVNKSVLALGLQADLSRHQTELYLTPGFGFEISNDLDLSMEVPIGLSEHSADWGFVLELTIGF